MIEVKAKAIRDLASSMARMAVSGRIADSLEALCSLSDGTLNIDLVAGSSPLIEGREVEMPIGPRLTHWFGERLAALEIPPASIEAATLELSHSTQRIPTDRSKIVAFDLEAVVCIASGGRRLVGEARGMQWHKRDAA